MPSTRSGVSNRRSPVARPGSPEHPSKRTSLRRRCGAPRPDGFDEQMRPFVFGLRRILAGMNNTERAAASFIKGLKGTNTNQEFLVRSAKKHSDYEQTF